jgi:hypothetical protein
MKTLILSLAGAMALLACKYDDNYHRRDSYREPARTTQTETPPSAEERYRAAETKNEEADLKARREAILNDLYDMWGGSETSQQLEKERQEPTNSEIVDDMKGGAAATYEKVDRAVFNKRCHDVGEGEEQSTATDREKEFFAREDVMAKCKEIFEIDQRLDALD